MFSSIKCRIRCIVFSSCMDNSGILWSSCRSSITLFRFSFFTAALYFPSGKLVKDSCSIFGRPYFSFASAKARIINAIFRARFLIVCRPSRSFFTSSAVKPCTWFQYVEEATGMLLMVKYLFNTSKLAVFQGFQYILYTIAQSIPLHYLRYKSICQL